MAGIKHHTLTARSNNAEKDVSATAWNEEHDAGTIADVLTDHDKAAHDALGIAPASHGNEAHSSTFLVSVTEADLDLSDNTTADTSSTEHGFCPKLNNNSSYFLNGQGNWAVPPDESGGGSGAAGKDGVGFVPNMLTLWDKSNGEVPEGFEEVSELANFTVIKYVGGEEMTNITHSIYFDVEANVTATVIDSNSTTQLTVAGATTVTSPFVNPHDNRFDINLAKSTAGDVTYAIAAADPNTGNNLVNIPTVTVPGESNIGVTIILPIASYITITQT